MSGILPSHDVREKITQFFAVSKTLTCLDNFAKTLQEEPITLDERQAYRKSAGEDLQENVSNWENSIATIAITLRKQETNTLKNAVLGVDYITDRPEALKEALESIDYQSGINNTKSEVTDILYRHDARTQQDYIDITYESVGLTQEVQDRHQQIIDTFEAVLDLENVLKTLESALQEGLDHKLPFNSQIPEKFVLDGAYIVGTGLRDALDEELKPLLEMVSKDFEVEYNERAKLHTPDNWHDEVNPLTGETIPYFKATGEFQNQLNEYRQAQLTELKMQRGEIDEDASIKADVNTAKQLIETPLAQMEFCENVDSALRHTETTLHIETLNLSPLDFLDNLGAAVSENYNKAKYNALMQEMGPHFDKKDILKYVFGHHVELGTEGNPDVTINIKNDDLEQKIEKLEGVLLAVGWNGQLPKDFPAATDLNDYISQEFEVRNAFPSKRPSRGPHTHEGFDPVETPKELYHQTNEQIRFAGIIQNLAHQTANYMTGGDRDLFNRYANQINDTITIPMHTLKRRMETEYGEEFLSEPTITVGAEQKPA